MPQLVLHYCCQLVARYIVGGITFHSPLIKGQLVKLLTFLLTNSLLTPWNGVLLKKLTGSRPVKKFPAFYETRRFITAVRGAWAVCNYMTNCSVTREC